MKQLLLSVRNVSSVEQEPVFAVLKLDKSQLTKLAAWHDFLICAKGVLAELASIHLIDDAEFVMFRTPTDRVPLSVSRTDDGFSVVDGIQLPADNVRIELSVAAISITGIRWMFGKELTTNRVPWRLILVSNPHNRPRGRLS